MAKKQTKSKPAPVCRRVWLMYPPKFIQQPIVWELTHKFDLVTNIRQASVTDEIGIVCLELQGAANTIQKAIRWLEGRRIKVEPVEMNVIDS